MKVLFRIFNTRGIHKEFQILERENVSIYEFIYKGKGIPPLWYGMYLLK